MESVTVRYRMQDGHIGKLEVPVVFSAGCLAVHLLPQYPGYDAPQKCWIITHVPTGCSTVGSFRLTNKAVALKVCRALATLDWTGVHGHRPVPAVLEQQIRAVYLAHGLLPERHIYS